MSSRLIESGAGITTSCRNLKMYILQVPVYSYINSLSFMLEEHGSDLWVSTKSNDLVYACVGLYIRCVIKIHSLYKLYVIICCICGQSYM